MIQDRLSKVENIEVHFKRKPKEILEQNQKVCGLLIENSDDQTTEELKGKWDFPIYWIGSNDTMCKIFKYCKRKWLY